MVIPSDTLTLSVLKEIDNLDDFMRLAPRWQKVVLRRLDWILQITDAKHGDKGKVAAKAALALHVSPPTVSRFVRDFRDGGWPALCDQRGKKAKSLIATLVRGGDLSTISREHGTGANPQQQDADALLEDDCAMVSETLQTQLDRLVIRKVHGDDQPAAYVVINPPSRKMLTKDLEIDQGLARLGVRQRPQDLAERYGRTLRKRI